MTLTCHSGAGDPAAWTGPEATALLSIESGGWFSRRALHQMIFGGVFERHPDLQLVLTEQPGDWWPYTLRELDSAWMAHSHAFRDQVPRLPSEYCAPQRVGRAAASSPTSKPRPRCATATPTRSCGDPTTRTWKAPTSARTTTTTRRWACSRCAIRLPASTRLRSGRWRARTRCASTGSTPSALSEVASAHRRTFGRELDDADRRRTHRRRLAGVSHIRPVGMSRCRRSAARVREDRGGRVAGLVLNRPEKLNAISREMIAELVDAVDDCVRDPDVGVIVIRGEGRAFAAGADASPSGAMRDRSANTNREEVLDELWGRFQCLWDAPKPVIAQVHGYCLGAGTILCSFADIVVVADDSEIGWPSLPLGGGVEEVLFAFYVGARKAKEYTFQIGHAHRRTRSARGRLGQPIGAGRSTARHRAAHGRAHGAHTTGPVASQERVDQPRRRSDGISRRDARQRGVVRAEPHRSRRRGGARPCASTRHQSDDRRIEA